MTAIAVASLGLLAALVIVLIVVLGGVGGAGAGTRVMPWGSPRPPRPGFARRAEIRALLGPRAARRPSTAPSIGPVATDDSPRPDEGT